MLILLREFVDARPNNNRIYRGRSLPLYINRRFTINIISGKHCCNVTTNGGPTLSMIHSLLSKAWYVILQLRILDYIQPRNYLQYKKYFISCYLYLRINIMVCQWEDSTRLKCISRSHQLQTGWFLLSTVIYLTFQLCMSITNVILDEYRYYFPINMYIHITYNT